MAVQLYNPFLEFKFDDSTCFLSGQQLTSAEEHISVFPAWMMHDFELEDKPFKMLDENMVTYQSLRLPCAVAVADRYVEIEQQVKEAMYGGYDEVRKLDDLVLFQWISKIVYGVVFNEIQAGIRQAKASGEGMNFSQALAHKFRNLHTMMQSVIQPMEFENRQPFSINVFPVDNADHTFLYRDEINTLIFSLRMKDFAIIATLQDNGTNEIYHEDILNVVKGQLLHPIQFEEICARFFYSAYLFNRLADYSVLVTPQKVFVDPMPLNDFTLKPIFDHWQNKTYGQVLENFWKPWGFTLFEIIQDPEHPMTFLKDENGHFRTGISLNKA